MDIRIEFDIRITCFDLHLFSLYLIINYLHNFFKQKTFSPNHLKFLMILKFLQFKLLMI